MTSMFLSSINDFKKSMEPKGLVMMSFISSFGWFFECLGLFLVLKGFEKSISISKSTFIFSFSSLAGAVSMIPGGLVLLKAQFQVY